MTLYRVTATRYQKRIATHGTWGTKGEAQKYADKTNEYIPGANARVVKDSERIRRMIVP